MMLTKSPNHGALPQSAPKRKLEEKGKEPKTAKQRRLEKVLPHVRQSPRRSTKDLKSEPGAYLEPLTCGVCAATFSSKSRAKFCVHMKRDHFLEVHYQCQACLKTFPDQRLLQHHKCQVSTAAADKQNKVQHTCTLCKLVFSSLYGINLHRWSSHGAKAYRCLQCSKLLGSVANLADHVRDHSRRPRMSSNRRPFSPHHRHQKLLFNKQKKKKKILKNDLDSAKSFQCDYCHQAFPNLSLTMEHRRGSHKEAKLICNCCQETFSDSTRLGQHLAHCSDDQSSVDPEMTDTAISSNDKEDFNSEKEILVGFPSSGSDVAPASSPATGTSTTADVCDSTTTDQEQVTPCKREQKTEIQTVASETPPTTKPHQKSKPACGSLQNQCYACKLSFIPSESKQVICAKCEASSDPAAPVLDGGNQEQHEPKAESVPPVTEVREDDKPEPDLVPNEPAGSPANGTVAISPLTAAESPGDLKSDKGEDEEDEENDPSDESKDQKKVYACDFCDQIFGSVTWIMRHRKKHDGAHLKCNICQIKFLQSSDLGHHLAECRQESTLSLCSTTSSSSTASSSNNACSSTLPLPAEKASGKSYVCDFCSQSFASVSWVMRHRKQHVDDLGNYWCRVCFETFDKSSGFGRHLADCVGVRKAPVPAQRPPLAAAPATTEKKEAGGDTKAAVEKKGKDCDQDNNGSSTILKRRFRCDFCSQKFASIRWVIRHRQQHTDDSTCQICFLKFDRTVELGRHFAAGCAVINDDESEPSMMKAPPKPKVPKPSASTETEASQNVTQPDASQASESKDDGVVYPCDFCLQSFASGRWVIRHRKQHEGGESLTCQRCQAQFGRSVDLSKHLTTCPKTQDISSTMSRSSLIPNEGGEEDGNERSFQCDICGQNYASARWVMRHRRTHKTPELPFVCHNCNGVFSKSVEISQHLRLCHSSPGLLSPADRGSRSVIGNPTEAPKTPSDPNQTKLEQSLKDVRLKSSFLSNIDLNTSDVKTTPPRNDSSLPLPVCIKVENFLAPPSPINLSLRPDSKDKSAKNPKTESFEKLTVAGGAENLDCLVKVSPVNLYQPKKLGSVTKKENDDKLADSTLNKIPPLTKNNLEKKTHSPKTPKGQIQGWQDPSVKSPGTGGKFTCDYCPNQFPDVMSLLSHRRKHSLSSSCHRCGKKYAKCIEVCQHLERCSPSNSSSPNQTGPKQYYCDFCLKTYGGSNWIMRHRRKHTDEKEYTCRVCKFSTKGAGFMARHLASCTWIKANLMSSSFQPKSNLAPPFVLPPPTTITCDFCSTPFKSVAELIQHRQYHTPEELTKCQHCGITIIAPKQMVNHLICCPANPTNQKPLPASPNRNGLIKHMDFKIKPQLKDPARRVDTERVFTCDFCGQGFATSDLVMQHRRFHTKESVYACRNCGKLFESSLMGNHLSSCKKSASASQSLPSPDFRAPSEGEPRVLDLKKTYTCDFCNKTFDNFNWILRHRLFHTSHVPYKCYRCGQTFEIARSMVDHLTSCHLSTSPGQVPKPIIPNSSDKMTYLCDRCGGHFPRTEVTCASEAATYRCHFCVKKEPLHRVLEQKMDGTCAYCVAGFDSPSSLQDHLMKCSANKHRNEFHGTQKAGPARPDDLSRLISSAPAAHSKITEPSYSEPEDLSISSLRTYPSPNRFPTTTSPRKSFGVEEYQQVSSGSASSPKEAAKTHPEKIFITQGSFERMSTHEQVTCAVPFTDLDKSGSLCDDKGGKNYDSSPSSGLPKDLRVETNRPKTEPEKPILTTREKNAEPKVVEVRSKEPDKKKESILSEHPSSNASNKNAKERFTQSLNLISKNSKFPCDFCDAAFATDSSLLSHRLTHVDENSLWCRLCRRAFTNSSDFVCHLTWCKIKHKNIHPLMQSPSPNKKEPYRCDFCDKSFSHRHAVMRHRQDHEQEEGIFRCRRCDCVFYRSTVFVGHLSICTSRISSLVPNRSRATHWSSYGKNGYIGSWRRLVSTNREKTQKLYYCDFCHRRFGGSNWIMRHRRTHVEGCIYTCQLCGSVFKQAGLMADHLTQCYSSTSSSLSSGPDTPNRSESESTASSPKTDDCREPRKESDGKKKLFLSPHLCKRCNCKFDTKENLEGHLSSCNMKPEEAKPMANDQQQKAPGKASLENPVSAPPVPTTSSKQTEYPCDFCGKSFIGVSWIMRHRHTHVADPRNLRCQQCRQGFENTSSFVSHLNSCVKPTDYCRIEKALQPKAPLGVAKPESDVGSGSSGMEDNTPVSFTFECCSQTFGHVADLTAHIKTHSRRPSS